MKNSNKLETAKLEYLEKTSKSIKLRFLKMYFEANAGHIGSSLSCADILTTIRFHWWAGENDEIILSKGHAAAALYSLLAEAGEISEDTINTFYKDGTYLAAHPPANKIPKVPFATGSLGHGLSLAAGLSLSDKFTGINRNVFCITSDGELNEGSIWEAALFSSHHKLENLYWFIDRNKIQGFGRTEDVMQLEPLKDKLASFGWNVTEVDGHDFNALENAMQRNKSFASNKPNAFICDTIKGKNMGELEDRVACHYLPIDQKGYLQILKNIS